MLTAAQKQPDNFDEILYANQNWENIIQNITNE